MEERYSAEEILPNETLCSAVSCRVELVAAQTALLNVS